MKRTALATILVALLVTLSCAPGPNSLTDTPGGDGGPAGFWMGLWHGFIVMFTFIASLIFDGVRIYEVHNTGGWYDFGFLLGVMCFFGGGSGGACCRTKRR